MLNSFRDASGGSISWPARNGGKNRAKGVPPLQFSHANGKQCKIARSTDSLPADGSLPARSPPLPICTPFRSHARGCVPRRDGRHSLSVLPETWSRLSHSRSRSQAATADCLPSARRREKSRHAGGIPKGKALWLLLHTSGRAEVCPRRDREKSPTNSNLISSCERRKHHV